MKASQQNILDTCGILIIDGSMSTALEKMGLDLNHKLSHTFPMFEAQKAFDFNDTRDPSIRKIVLTLD